MSHTTDGANVASVEKLAAYFALLRECVAAGKIPDGKTGELVKLLGDLDKSPETLMHDVHLVAAGASLQSQQVKPPAPAALPIDTSNLTGTQLIALGLKEDGDRFDGIDLNPQEMLRVGLKLQDAEDQARERQSHAAVGLNDFAVPAESQPKSTSVDPSRMTGTQLIAHGMKLDGDRFDGIDLNQNR